MNPISPRASGIPYSTLASATSTILFDDGRVAAKAQAERKPLEVPANPGKDKKISCLHDCAQKVICERVSEEKQAGRPL
jgi:hypothetical protein